MAHFAEVSPEGRVLNTIVVANEILQQDGEEVEQLGIDFINSLGVHESEGSVWVQTSYNNNFRNVFGAMGAIYDSELDKFSEPQPYPSWTLNNDFVWEAQTPRPEDHNAETGPYYVWDEDNANWSAEYPPTGGEGAD